MFSTMMRTFDRVSLGIFMALAVTPMLAVAVALLVVPAVMALATASILSVPLLVTERIPLNKPDVVEVREAKPSKTSA